MDKPSTQEDKHGLDKIPKAPEGASPFHMEHLTGPRLPSQSELSNLIKGKFYG
jgi:hypothetical protein